MRISVFMTYDKPGRAGLFSPECRYQRYRKWEERRVLRWCRDMRTWHLTQHAMKIDSFLAGNGTNMAQGTFADLVNIA